MKKIIGVLALMLLFAAAASNAGTKKEKLTTKNDSLAYYYGKMVGYGVSSEMMHGADSAKIDKKEVLKGFRSVMDVDTTNVSYLRGIELANAFKSMFKGMKMRDNLEIDQKMFVEQFVEAFLSKNQESPEKYQGTVMGLMKSISEEGKARELAENKAKEDAYFANLAKDATLKKTESGVYYKVISEGSGESFGPDAKIMVKYEGRHLNGEVFDKSKNGPVEMSPKYVIPGFGEMLKIMKPGSHYVVYIPGAMAYGERGTGPIKPGEALIFDLETEGLKKVDEAKN